MKRCFDIFLVIFLAFILLIPTFFIVILIKLTSKGPIIFWSDRIGKNNKLFKMAKFRTMLICTPIVASDKLENPINYFTPIGSFLRLTSLDELPQLFNILIGDMSFVGPRPALFNQDDLIKLRTKRGVHKLLPGLSGWAQINGRDDLPINEKVALDLEYMKRQSFGFDLKILCLTFFRVIIRDGVSH
jgi:O-antigen biosynthesis protein WbqP